MRITLSVRGRDNAPGSASLGSLAVRIDDQEWAVPPLSASWVSVVTAPFTPAGSTAVLSVCSTTPAGTPDSTVMFDNVGVLSYNVANGGFEADSTPAFTYMVPSAWSYAGGGASVLIRHGNTAWNSLHDEALAGGGTNYLALQNAEPGCITQVIGTAPTMKFTLSISGRDDCVGCASIGSLAVRLDDAQWNAPPLTNDWQSVTTTAFTPAGATAVLSICSITPAGADSTVRRRRMREWWGVVGWGWEGRGAWLQRTTRSGPEAEAQSSAVTTIISRGHPYTRPPPPLAPSLR